VDRDDVHLRLAVDSDLLDAGHEPRRDKCLEGLGGVPEVGDVETALIDGGDVELAARRGIALPVDDLADLIELVAVTPSQCMNIAIAIGLSFGVPVRAAASRRGLLGVRKLALLGSPSPTSKTHYLGEHWRR